MSHARLKRQPFEYSFLNSLDPAGKRELVISQRGKGEQLSPQRFSHAVGWDGGGDVLGEGLSPWRPACPVQSEEGVSAVVLTLLQ